MTVLRRRDIKETLLCGAGGPLVFLPLLERIDKLELDTLGNRSQPLLPLILATMTRC